MSNFVNKLLTQTPRLANQAVIYMTPRLLTFAKYAKVELTPPMPTDIPAIVRGFGSLVRSAKNGSYKQLTVREAWLNTLITVEIFGWFCIGECIGKRSLVGYQV